MNAMDLGWEDIFAEPFVILELGARGEGKTALGHRLLEVFANADKERDAYIMGFPDDKQHLLPEWIDVLPPGTPKHRWPENSIVLIHEAHQLLHARRSMDAENLELDQLVTISRHKDSNIIYDTQQSHRLDKNAVAAVDGILARWPALMQEDFERRAIKPIVKEAREVLSKYVTVHDEDDFTYVERKQNENGVDELKKHVFVHADQFRGEFPHELQLADHWHEDISKAYGGADDSKTPQETKTLEDVRADMAEPDEIEEKDIEEVAGVLEIEEGEEVPASSSDTSEEDTSSEEPSGSSESGREFIDRMKASDNQVLANNYGTSLVEIIVPEDISEETEQLIDEWDMNPAGPDIYPQDPSFSEERPDVAEDLVSFQFLLDDGDGLGTAGYDLEQIIEGMEGEPFLLTKSNTVTADLPV